MTIKWLRFIPIVIAVAIVALLWRGLYLNPKEIPSPLINQQAPAFDLPDLFSPNTHVTNTVFQNHITILNVWASWCETCVDEQTFIRSIANQYPVQWLGFDYKDTTADAKAWLAQYGNPYHTIVTDANGQAALDFGIYGTPETFIIDGNGVIRYKHIGPITASDWQQDFVPWLIKLNRETA